MVDIVLARLNKICEPLRDGTQVVTVQDRWIPPALKTLTSCSLTNHPTGHMFSEMIRTTRPLQERSPATGRAGEGAPSYRHRGPSDTMLTSVSSSILAPSACSRASKVSREVLPELWSAEITRESIISLHLRSGQRDMSCTRSQSPEESDPIIWRMMGSK